jgi:uncharacterized protein YjbJ (UPF0337 family)
VRSFVSRLYGNDRFSNDGKRDILKGEVREDNARREIYLQRYSF